MNNETELIFLDTSFINDYRRGTLKYWLDHYGCIYSKRLVKIEITSAY